MQEIKLYPSTSAATSFVSNPIDLVDLRDYCITVEFTGSDVAGTVSLSVKTSQHDTAFVMIEGSDRAVTTSGTKIYNVTNANYRLVVVNWTYSSGTGNITVYANLKNTVVKIS